MGFGHSQNEFDVLLVHSSNENDLYPEKDTRVFLSDVNKRLSLSVRTKFDQNDFDEIKEEQKIQAVEASERVVIFITGNINDAEGNSRAQTAAQIQYATNTKPRECIIPVVMDQSMLDKRNWKGILRQLLDLPYVDMSSKIHRTQNIDTLCELILSTKAYGTYRECNNYKDTVSSAVQNIDDDHCFIDDVLQYMEDYLFSEEIQWKSCKWISNLEPTNKSEISTRHYDQRQEVFELGGCARILRAMEAHTSSQLVQTYACQCIMHLARDSAYRRKLMRAGAGSLILRAIDNHKGNCMVQVAAWSAIRELANSSTNLRVLKKLQVEKRLVETMVTHKFNEDVQINTCGAIKNICVDPGGQLLLMHSDAAYYVLVAMDSFPKSQKIQEQGCAALRNLAASKEDESRLMNLNAAQRIIVAMKSFPFAENLQEHACGALFNFSFLDESKSRMVRLDGVGTLLSTMKNHPSNENIQDTGCSVLWLLAKNPSLKLTLRNLDALGYIEQSMTDFPYNPYIQRRGKGAIEAIQSK